MWPIKFRAWDYDDNKMVYFSGIFNRQPYTEMSTYVQYESCPKYHKLSDLEPFIGLYDKNGKEIFEGDVVLTDEAGWIGHVVYCHDAFVVVDDKGGFSSCCNWDAFEVIGNIHETEVKA